MITEVKKLVFTEFESDPDSQYVSYMAESPFGTYYIDYDKYDHTFKSYTQYADIGEDDTLAKAKERTNEAHRNNVLDCFEWD